MLPSRGRSQFLSAGAGLLNSCLVSLRAVGRLRGIHSNSSDELFHTHPECKPAGPAHGPTRSRRCRLRVPRHQQRQSGRHGQLGGACNHVCDEGSAGRIGDGDTVRAGLGFLQGGSEGDTTLPSSFQSVQDPGTPGRPSLSAASFASFSVVLLSVPRTCRPDGQWW